MTQQAQPQGGQPAAPQPGTPEYDVAMAATYDAQNKPAPEVPPLTPPKGDERPAKPDWLPDKFWNAEKGEANFEALAKSYGELEKSKSGKPADPPKADDKTAGDGKGSDKPTDGQKPALDFDAIGAEFYGDGLSEASRKGLEGLGIPGDILDAVQGAFKAQAELLSLRMEQHVGGKDKLAELQAWGKANLSDADKQLVDAQINAGAWQAALDYIAFKRGQAPASAPRIETGGTPAANDGAFGSQAEMMAAIADPRYAADPVFRRSVEQRIVRTNFR